MAYTIAFFGSKPYDEASFNEKNSEYGFELRYYKGHLNLNNVILTQGVDAVCIFVNDTADAEVIRQMAANGVKLLALRCAGYNNVDLKAAAENGITVVRVPAYSPYAVAESFRLAVYSYLPVPKWLAASLAARSLVMWFISISTPMVCFFRFSICLSVLAFIMFSSVVSGFFPFVVPILTLNGGDSKRLNVQKMRAKDCVEYTLAILAIVW